MKTTNIYYIHDDGTAELLCQNTKVLLDAEDVKRVSEYQWSMGTHGYITSGAGQKQILLHRLISAPKGSDVVDHINRIKTDNRKCNLRIVDSQTNSFNRDKQSNNTSGYKGVCQLSDGTWQAQIQHCRRALYLGTYDDVESAAKAYDIAAINIFGECACLNFDRDDYENTPYIQNHIKRKNRLSTDQAAHIRELRSQGFSINEIAQIYDHSYSSISRIVRNKTFKGDQL